MKGRQVVLGRHWGAEAAALMVDGRVEDLLFDLSPLTPLPPGAICRAVVDRLVKGQGGVFVRLPEGERGFLRDARGLSEGQALIVQVSGAAEKTRGRASAVGSASEEASANVQTVASAAEELTASLDEVAGQGHLLRPGSPLVALADAAGAAKTAVSVILWGPQSHWSIDRQQGQVVVWNEVIDVYGTDKLIGIEILQFSDGSIIDLRLPEST